jgi:L-alanine-DL-glutamate epimerase-like enolase superfamily enzyme
MQITRAEVIPVELKLRQPVSMANLPAISHVTAVFVRIETRQGESAWGCSVAHPDLTGDRPEDVLRACQECASIIPGMHPTNIEYSLSELARLVPDAPTALCAASTWRSRPARFRKQPASLPLIGRLSRPHPDFGDHPGFPNA